MIIVSGLAILFCVSAAGIKFYINYSAGEPAAKNISDNAEPSGGIKTSTELQLTKKWNADALAIRLKILTSEGKQNFDIEPIQFGQAFEPILHEEIANPLDNKFEENNDLEGRNDIPYNDPADFERIENPRKVRTLTSEVVPYDGAIRSITCWGDSLTEGTGADTSIIIDSIRGATMPSTLASLTKQKVYNMGVYGEVSSTIACRQGGMSMYVKNIVIPASGSVEIGDIICENGDLIYPNCWHECEATNACFDSCSIAGITGKISYEWDTDSYVFTRTTPGEELELTTDTPIITPPSLERVNDILIIEMGNNGGWRDYDDLISQYDAMIEHSNYRYYIIIGDTDGSAEDNAEWESALQNAYGAHFVNMRAYLATYGLRDMSNVYKLSNFYKAPIIPAKSPASVSMIKAKDFTPTEKDLELVSVGAVPFSLKMEDETHLNVFGYYIEGMVIYRKGVELGYWK